MTRIGREDMLGAARIRSLEYSPRENEGSIEDVARREKASARSVRRPLLRTTLLVPARLRTRIRNKILMVLVILTSPYQTMPEL
jgi:hypothetical protein